MVKFGTELVPYAPIANRTRRQIRKKQLSLNRRITFLLTNPSIDHDDQAFLDFMESVVLKDVPSIPELIVSPVKSEQDSPTEPESIVDVDVSTEQEMMVQQEISIQREWMYKGIEVSKTFLVICLIIHSLLNLPEIVNSLRDSKQFLILIHCSFQTTGLNT